MSVAKHVWAASKALLVLSLILGVAYPLVITAVGLAFPGQSKRSLVRVGDREVGSSLLGQAAEDPRWFSHGPRAPITAGR